MGDTTSSENGTNIHGLFGAIIVEAAESAWLDPQTGKELESGLFADIYNPAKPSFREYAVFFHDELEMKDKDGRQPMDPHTELPSSTTAISYRSEPMRNRLPLTDNHADFGEDISMSSWVYSDPAPHIPRAYVGDPSKIRLIHGGIKETHVFHLHNHLYPHFHEGMWTLWRIHDRLEDGTGTLPDGTPIPPLCPLKDRAIPPKKDELHPGYPNFINGTFGQRPPQPPLGILEPDGTNKINPTTLEQANTPMDGMTHRDGFSF